MEALDPSGENPKTAIVHIGLPKTGSTSLQALLQKNKTSLREQGFDFYTGWYSSRRNHNELYLSTIRDGVDTFGSLRDPRINKAKMRARTRLEIAAQFSRTARHKVIFSAEGLSFLRTPKECRRLKALFPTQTAFRILLVLRDRTEWLSSYEQQIYKVKGRKASNNPKSSLYVGDGTWLTDFSDLEDAYSQVFGKVELIQYDRETVLSDVLGRIGVTPSFDVTEFRLNSS